MTALGIAIAVWLGAWGLNVWLAGSAVSRTKAGRVLVPLIFGATVLVLWEGLVRGLGVSPVIPGPGRCPDMNFPER